MLCPLVHSPSFYTQKLLTYLFPSALSTPLGGMPYPWNKVQLLHTTALGMIPCPSEKLQRYTSPSAQVSIYTIINFICKTLSSESATVTRFYTLTCVRIARSACFNLLARGNRVSLTYWPGLRHTVYVGLRREYVLLLFVTFFSYFQFRQRNHAVAQWYVHM